MNTEKKVETKKKAKKVLVEVGKATASLAGLGVLLFKAGEKLKGNNQG